MSLPNRLPLSLCLLLTLTTAISSCGPSVSIIEENAVETREYPVQSHAWYNTDHHGRDDRFYNPWPREERRSSLKSVAWLAGRMLARPEGEPPPTIGIEPEALQSGSDNAQVFWVGHATTLIQHRSTIILTDPIFSERASPVGFAGPTRLQNPAISIDDLPHVDVVVISHSHYDHLDRPSIVELHERYSPLFLVPLEMERILHSWGVTGVISLDWWQYVDVDGLRVHSTPAHHWSTRRMFDRNRVLWSSWYFEWPEDDLRIFFGGDTAYGPFFREIGERLGAPHIAMMPIGAYEPRWFMRSSHVSPEEAVQAFVDLNAGQFLGIHWGTFHQSDEPLDEPPRLTRAAAREHGIDLERIHVPPVGGRVDVEP